MSRFRLNRRTVLRGAGSVAIALPWLEIMAPEQAAHARALPARKFVAVFTPGGSVLEDWRPTGSEASFELGPILKPLEAVRDKLLILSGVDMPSKRGEQNQAGLIAWLTATAQSDVSQFATGPSIDQVLAKSLSQGQRITSLEVAVRWGTGKARGLVSPIDIANFADDPTFTPVAPRLDPVKIWQELFGELPAPDPWDKSILDAVTQRFHSLEQRLGTADRARLDAHLTRLRELELRLATGPAGCAPPPLVDTSDYNPNSGLNSSDVGDILDLPTDNAIPKVGKLMTDMLVMALACDLTSVGTLQWSDTEAKHTFPWLGLKEHLHFYMNDGGYHPIELTKIFTWYSEQHAYLIEQLAAIPAASGSLLDETLLFFGSQLQNPATHTNTDMPFLLAGGGGGLRTNRWLTYDHASHNDLLVALFNLCGDNRQTFGTPNYCTGPLGGLT